MRKLTHYEVEGISGGNWFGNVKEYVAAGVSALTGGFVGGTSAVYFISSHAYPVSPGLEFSIIVSGAMVGVIAGNYLYQGLYALRKANDFPTG